MHLKINTFRAQKEKIRFVGLEVSMENLHYSIELENNRNSDKIYFFNFQSFFLRMCQLKSEHRKLFLHAY